MTASGTTGRPSPSAPPDRPATAPEDAAARTLAVVSVSTLLVLATFVTPLATGVRTAATFGTGPAGQAWLLSAMSVGLAAALLVAGAVADQTGRRRTFVAGLVLMALGAVAAAAAGSTGLFLAGRLLEGVGGAAVLACSMGLISAAFPLGPARARAAAVWGASVGAGTGIGGLLAVAVDTGSGWRASYAVTAVLGMAALAMSAVSLTVAAWILGVVVVAALATAAWLKTIDMTL